MKKPFVVTSQNLRGGSDQNLAVALKEYLNEISFGVKSVHL